MKRHLLLYLIILCCTSTLILANNFPDRQSKIDSLKKLDLTESVAEQLAYQYNFIGEDYAQSVDSTADNYIDSIRQLQKKFPSPLTNAYLERLKGRRFDLSGDKATGIGHYQNAIEHFKLSDQDPSDLAFTYVILGFALNNSDQADKAMEVLNEGLPYAKDAEGKNSLAFILDYFGDVHFYDGYDGIDYEVALDYYKQVEELFDTIQHNGIISDNYSCQAVCYLRLGNETKALEYKQKGESLGLEHNMRGSLFGLYNQWAWALEEMGRKSEAAEYYDKAYEVVKDVDQLEFKSRGEDVMYNYYRRSGNFEQALYHFERHREMEDTLSDEAVKTKYAELEKKYELEKKQGTIDRLSNKSLRLSRNILLLALLGSGIIASLLVWAFGKQKKSNRLLSRKNEEINAAMVSGRNLERKRLASELHDNLNTKIAAVSWRLDALKDVPHEKAPDLIDETSEMLGEMYEDVRQISHNLMPSAIKSKGLFKSLDKLVERLNVNDNDLTIEFRPIGSDDSLSEEKSYELYNIVFETINNVLKHAKASETQIVIEAMDNKVKLTVRDNGQGFDQKSSEQGVGLTNIDARIKSLKGHWNIDSKHEQGTTISAEIPILN